MNSLPDRKRTGLSEPTRALAASAAHLAAAATWRLLHPAERGPYLEAQRPKPLQRLYYTSRDGWRACLFHLPPRPGGTGEPVILAHGLGLAPDAFRYGRGVTLASHLVRAGYSVYLLGHRGDRCAMPPRQGSDFCFDDLVDYDVSAAIQRVLDHSGMARVHWVGHGLGGQLGLASAPRWPDTIASVVAIQAAVTFHAPSSETRRRRMLTLMLPRGWALPTRLLARAICPAVDGIHWADGLADRVGAARLRGALHHVAADLPVGLLRQITEWQLSGSLVSRRSLLDYREALVDAHQPLLVVAGAEDPVCSVEAAVAATETWAGPSQVVTLDDYGYLDPLLAADAASRLFPAITGFLDPLRRDSWPERRSSA